MKFKTLLNKITTLVENSGEHTIGGGLYIGDPQGKIGQSPLTDKGTFNLQLPRQIDAINAMLHTFSGRDYIDPNSVLAVAKQKLSMVGLDFKLPKTQLSDGLTMVELVQYGSPDIGVYGQNPYDDVNKKGFAQGDGIKEKLGTSLGLSITVEKQPNHLRKVSLVIVPIADSSYNNADSMTHDCGCQH
jgi:hypothetical protein